MAGRVTRLDLILLALAVGVPALLGVVVFGSPLRPAHQDWRLPKCLANLNGIARALVQYHADFGRLPAQIEELAGEWGGCAPSQLRCPADDPNTICSYTLVTGIIDSHDPNLVLAYETVAHHRNARGAARRCVAFADGSARLVPEEDFPRILAATARDKQ